MTHTYVDEKKNTHIRSCKNKIGFKRLQQHGKVFTIITHDVVMCWITQLPYMWKWREYVATFKKVCPLCRVGIVMYSFCDVLTSVFIQSSFVLPSIQGQYINTKKIAIGSVIGYKCIIKHRHMHSSFFSCIILIILKNSKW